MKLYAAALFALLASGTTISAANTGQVYFRGVLPSASERGAAISFGPVIDALLGASAVSTPAAYSGPGRLARIDFDGGEGRICMDAACQEPVTGWGASGEVRPGLYVQMRVVASMQPGATVSARASVAGVTTAFSATTRHTAPSIGVFADASGEAHALVESDLVSIQGWANAPIRVENGAYRICSASGCGSFTEQAGTVREGDEVQLRATAGAEGEDVEVVLRIGEASSTWRVIVPVVAELYPFNVHLFTTCGASGRLGPTLAACRDAYAGVGWEEANLTMDRPGIQLWRVPARGTYRILATGASSGIDRWGSDDTRGRGAQVGGTFPFEKGQVLQILVGQTGTDNPDFTSASGGGGSFVATSDNVPLIVAGGGGGVERTFSATRNPLQDASHTTAGNRGWGTAGHKAHCGYTDGGINGDGGHAFGFSNSGGGGGGFYAPGRQDYCNGAQCVGQSFVAGGQGGASTLAPAGGFGGGGAAYGNGGGSGGGGGYSGGAAGKNCQSATAGGGGSYNIGADPDGSRHYVGPGFVRIKRVD